MGPQGRQWLRAVGSRCSGRAGSGPENRQVKGQQTVSVKGRGVPATHGL